MLVIRPVQLSDLDELYELSALAGSGLTTLPHDRRVLERRVKSSILCFENMAEKPEGEDYVFVMEDLKTKKVVGISAIFSKVGGFEPFYTYQIKTMTIESKALGVKKKIKYLKLLSKHNGPTEIGTLFIHPDYRKGGLGRFLSLSRFLFLAQYPQCFEETVLAEMRGLFDKDGHSPFWEDFARHFFDVEFEKADLMVMQDKSFIEDLMPKHPIYIPLLSKQAQAAIGCVHPNSAPAKHLLESEGFAFNNQIDIFEAGPVLSCKTKNIRTVRESKLALIAGIQDLDIESAEYLVIPTRSMREYRAVKTHAGMNDDGTLIIPSDAARVLKVAVGDSVRYVPLKSPKK